MKILSIGNSFSCDAQRYLYRIAKKDGVNIKAVNLFIGGCSLRTHYLNILQDSVAYAFQFNGEDTGLKVSISQALASDDWDVVTLQQASHFSSNFDTYIPYLEYVAEYVKKYCPRAKIYIHQTWAYENNSERLKNAGYECAEDMFKAIEESYAKAADCIKADGIIPCGKAMYNATQFGIEKIHRDTFHASLGVGRYLLGLTWYKKLLGKDITCNDYDEFDVPVSQAEREIVIQAVNAAFNEKNDKKFLGKTFLFLGDSLTEGVRGTTSQRNRYTEVFAKLCGATTYSYGVGGTRIAFQKQPTIHKPRHDMYFASRVVDMRAEADYVVVFGGSNDLAEGDAPLGTFGDTTPMTFYGALHDLYTRLRAKYPQATLIAVTPIHRMGDEGDFINKAGVERIGGMAAYANAIKQVAAAFGVHVLDAYSSWEMNPNIDSQRKTYFCEDDLHPNDNGHRYIAERFLEYMESLEA